MKTKSQVELTQIGLAANRLREAASFLYQAKEPSLAGQTASLAQKVEILYAKPTS